MEAERSEIEDKVFKRFEADPMCWGRVMFEKHFRDKSPMFHFDLMRAAQKSRFLVVGAPRGSAKSTLLSFVFPFHGIVFKKFRFIVLISNTFKKASMNLDTIKKEIADNQLFKESFAPINIIRDAEGDSEFRHQDGFETKFLCKGVDQLGSLRGVKFRAYRPDLVIIDDLEDDEMVKNQARRAELSDEFDEVLNQLGDKTTKFVIVGTVLHDDSQLAKLLSPDRYPEFSKILLKAHHDVGKKSERSLWPERWSVDYLRDLQKTKPNVYAKEMQNDPVAGSNQRFSKDMFRYWRIEGSNYILLNKEGQVESYGSLKDCKAGVACDLAWKEKRSNDSSVLMPGFITPNSEILIDYYITKKGMRPDETAENLFVMVDRLEKITGSNVPVGFEKAMLENVTQWLLRREMQKRNKFILTKELIWDADKNTRIETRLQPRYSQGVIFHRQGMGDLEYQLERFPTGAFDDLADCAQGLVQVLQFPKKVGKKVEGEDAFMRVRRHMIEEKEGKKDRFVGFGKKIKLRGIIARRAVV